MKQKELLSWLGRWKKVLLVFLYLSTWDLLRFCFALEAITLASPASLQPQVNLQKLRIRRPCFKIDHWKTICCLVSSIILLTLLSSSLTNEFYKIITTSPFGSVQPHTHTHSHLTSLQDQYARIVLNTVLILLSSWGCVYSLSLVTMRLIYPFFLYDPLKSVFHKNDGLGMLVIVQV